MGHWQASIAYASLNLAMIGTIHEWYTEINLKLGVSDHTWFNFQLLRIEEELGSNAKYVGASFRNPQQ